MKSQTETFKYLVIYPLMFIKKFNTLSEYRSDEATVRSKLLLSYNSEAHLNWIVSFYWMMYPMKFKFKNVYSQLKFHLRVR